MREAWSRAAAERRLGRAFEELALESPPGSAQRLIELCELLARWASRASLTAHRSPGAILDRLVLDALALAALLPAAASWADLGSGAGFPGLPLAILFPERQLILVEARERKHHFQREAVRRLGLGNVRPLLGRSDEMPAEPCAGALAQAMAPAREVVELLLPWAEPGGWLAIPGGEQPPLVPPSPGVREAEIRSYRLPLTGVSRSLWIGRRDAGDG